VVNYFIKLRTMLAIVKIPPVTRSNGKQNIYPLNLIYGLVLAILYKTITKDGYILIVVCRLFDDVIINN